MGGSARRLGLVVSLVLVVGLLAVPMPAVADDLVCTITGTEGDDVLVGTNQADVICGLGGDDVIDAGNGDDVVYGGSGADVVHGGNGNDVLYGEAGADEIWGDNGDDTIFGGADGDSLDGGRGNDAVTGDAGDDSLAGDNGDDALVGAAGTDTVDGGKGDDGCAGEVLTGCETEVPDEGSTTPELVQIVSPASDAVVFSEVGVSVAVAPAEAAGTVSLLVDGDLVGSEPIEAGVASVAWDTTSVADGGHVLVVQAADEAGVVTADCSVAVTVANGLSASERIQSDGEAGLLSVDEYVEYGLWSVTNPSLLPAGYGSGSALDDTDPTGEALWFLAPWDAVTQQTRDALTEYLTVTEVMVPPPDVQPMAAAAAGSTDECGASSLTYLPVKVISGKVFRCRHDVVASDGSVPFEIYYNVDAQSSDVGFWERLRLAWTLDIAFYNVHLAEPVHGDTSSVPQAITEMATSLLQSRDTYLTELDMDDAGPVAVAVHDIAGMVLPPLPGVRQTVQVNNRRSYSYMPRHELYHLFQYEYVGAEGFIHSGEILQHCLLAVDYQAKIQCMNAMGTDAYRLVRFNWFQELTAEWATHQVQIYRSLTSEVDQYARALPARLGVPAGSLVSWDGFAGQIQYGTFVWAEWLEQQLSPSADTQHFDPTIITEMWQAMDANGGNPIDAAATVAGAHGKNLPVLINGYSIANYLVYVGADPIAYVTADADPIWIDWLEDSAETEGDTGTLETQLGLDSARPARTTEVAPDGHTVSASAYLGAGGSSYVELLPTSGGTPPEGRIHVQVTVDQGASQGDVRVTALPMDTYPDLCDNPIPVTITDGEGSVDIPIDATCQFGTLVITNTTPEHATATVDWEATFLEEGNLLTNPGFETGDFTGWGTFLGPYADASYSIETARIHSAPYEGIYAASVESTGMGPAGFEQDVQVAAGASYTASVEEYRLLGYQGVALQILDANGILIATTPVELEWSDWSWHRLSTSFVAPTDTVAVRLTWVDKAGEESIVWFDDAHLERSDRPGNLAFEAGTLNGWTTVAYQPTSTSFEVRDDGRPGAADPYAAHITFTSPDANTAGLVRDIATSRFNTAWVAVSGTPGAVAALVVTDETGSEYSEDIVLDGTWQLLQVYTGVNEQGSIRLGADRGTATGDVDVAFDGVYLAYYAE